MGGGLILKRVGVLRLQYRACHRTALLFTPPLDLSVS